MKRAVFEAMVRDGFLRLPAWVRSSIRNVALIVEDNPSLEDREMQGLTEEETLLGLYKGTPLSERSSLYDEGIVLPDTITLYKNPLLTAAEEDGLDIRDVIADTIWHEFAHHFGLTEVNVRAREKERGIGDFRRP